MRNIKILLAVAALLLPAYLQAGGGKDEWPAVSYVQADSISLEDIFFSRLLNDYMGNDSSMRSKPVVLTPKERRKLVSDSAEWKRDIAWRLTLWGTTPTASARENFYTAARMFLIEPRYEYADIMERTLYNGVISGMSADGGKFFYPNPLAADGKYGFNHDGSMERQAWFGCACCPSNLCRFIPSMPGYVYATRGDSLYVNLFAGNTATMSVGGREVTLQQQTQYPWSGDVELKVTPKKEGSFTMMVRIPGWVRGEVTPGGLYEYADSAVQGYWVAVNGKRIGGSLAKGYLPITREWKKGDVVSLHMDMTPRTVKADSRVSADRGRVAISRGPLVYCAEWADNQFDVMHFVIDTKPQFTLTDAPTLAGGVKKLAATGTLLDTGADGKLTATPRAITLIPYYAWCHRGPGRMQVWLAAGTEVMEER